MKKYSQIALFLLPIIFVSCNKNDPKPDDSGLFIKFFGTAKNSAGYSLVEIQDGFVLAGTSTLDGQDDADILVIKTDKNGNRMWEKRINSGRNEEAFCVKERDGILYVLGYQQQKSADSTDVFLVTMSAASGDAIKTFVFGDSATSEVGYSLTFLSGDSLLIAGTNTLGTDRNMQVMKVSGSTVKWKQVVGVIGEDDVLNKVISVSGNRFLWCGSVERSGESNLRLGLSNRDGLLQWQYEFYMFDGINQYGRDVIENGNSFVVVGSSGDVGSGNEKLTVMQIDQNGSWEWGEEPAGSSTSGYSISPSSDGGFIVGGYSTIGNDNTDYLLLKINARGLNEWSKNFGGKRNDHIQQVVQTSDGGYAMVGLADLFDNRNAIMAFIKSDNSGNVNSK